MWVSLPTANQRAIVWSRQRREDANRQHGRQNSRRSLLRFLGKRLGSTPPVRCHAEASLAPCRECAPSMQHRSLEEVTTVAGAHAQLKGLALAVDEQRHLDACLAQRP